MADQFEFGIRLDADTRDADDLAKSIGGINDELEGTGDEGEKTERALKEAFDEGADAAEKARLSNREFNGILRETRKYAERTGQDFESAFEDIQRAARDAGIEIEDHTLEAMQRIGRQGPDELDKVKTALKGLDDAGNEAATGLKDAFDDSQITKDDLFAADLKAETVSALTSTGAEVVRGFKDGFDSEDLGTLLDGATDAAADFGALFGPAGAVGGLALGAVAQTVLGPFVEESKALAEEFEKTYASAFDSVVENGAEMGRELAIQNTVSEIAKDTEAMNEVQRQANTLNVEAGIILRARAGDQDALNVVTSAANDLESELQEKYSQTTETITRKGQAHSESVKISKEEQAQLDAVSGALDSVTSKHNNETDALNAGTDAAKAKAQADEFATQKALAEAKAIAQQTRQAQDLTVELDGVSQAIRVMPDGKIVKVTDDGTAKLTQQEIDEIHGRTVGIRVVADTGGAEGAINRMIDRQSGRTVSITAQVTGKAGLYAL